MSNFVNALKSFTPTQFGEKGHVEKTWSFDVDEIANGNGKHDFSYAYSHFDNFPLSIRMITNA